MLPFGHRVAHKSFRVLQIDRAELVAAEDRRRLSSTPSSREALVIGRSQRTFILLGSTA